MRKNLDEINKDILEKIDNMDIEDNIKNFLKEALFIEFNNRCIFTTNDLLIILKKIINI